MYDQEGSEGGPKGSFENFKAEGDVLFKQGEYLKALASFNTALELKPGDKNCLVARSQCYLELGDPDKALADAESTLEEEPNYIKGLLQKADALYQKGDFEFALVFYHRGYQSRPEVQEFRLGIQKSQEAIENSIGMTSNVKLESTGDLSYFYKADDNDKKKKKKQTAYSKPVHKKDERGEKRRPRAVTRDQKTTQQLLGELYNDHEYLQTLLNEIDSADRVTDTNNAIRDLTIDCLDYLDTRTDFWQQQKPMYSRKRDKNMRDNARARGGLGKQNPTNYVLNNLEKIDDYQSKGKHEDSLKLAKKTLKEVEKWSDDDIPNRHEVVANLHSSIGNAHLEMGDCEQALQHHNLDLEIAKQHDLDESLSRALDNIGRVHARTGNFEKAIEVWEEKIPKSKSAIESAWLYHEIGRCHLELEHYEEARDYGEKSLVAAEKSNDGMWQLNASVLIAQAQVKLNELQAALESFERSLDMAQVQNDKAAEAAIKKAINDINQKIAKEIKESGGTKGDKSSESNPVEYKITINTGESFGSGTNANVSINIHGESGESGDRRLDNTSDNFENGGIDIFTVKCPSLGKLDHVRIWHDNEGMGNGWFLDKIIIETEETTYEFPCNRWLADDEDDKQVSRVLYCNTGTE